MRLELQLRAYAPHRIDTFPSDSDSGTMRKVLNWGVVPLNLKWQGMVVHGLCWARTNSPENIRRFNSKRPDFPNPQSPTANGNDQRTL